MYNQKVMNHFHQAKNMGKVDNPDGVGQVGNMACGDIMELSIKVSKNEQDVDVISEVKFQTLGCAAAIATSSITTELAKNKTIDEALAIDKKTIIDELGGLPQSKIHCSVLASEALAMAIHDYLTKNSLSVPPKLQTVYKKLQARSKH